MKSYAVLFVSLLAIVLLSGCIENSNQTTDNSAQDAESEVMNTTTPVTVSDCVGTYPDPTLWYIKNGDITNYYVYLAPEDINYDEHVLDESTVKVRSTLTDSEKISLELKYCRFGYKQGENINYLYCDPLWAHLVKLSPEGEILNNKKFNVNVIFSVDKTKDRPETVGTDFSYALVDEAKLVNNACKVSNWR